MTSALVPTENPASVPVQNPHWGAFLAERTALALKHLAAAMSLCKALEALLQSGAPIDHQQFKATGQRAAEHMRLSSEKALLKLDEIEGQA